MKNFMTRAAAMVLALVIIVSSSIFAINVDAASYSTSSNSGQRDEICTSLDGTGAASYYTGSYTYDKLSAMSQSTLLTSLRTLMTSTHTYKSSYNDCHYKADITDCENNNGKVSLIYTSYSATMSQWNGWNREHVWPQSLGGGNTSGGGADLHHIRPSDAVVNSTRGNKKYGYANGGKAVYGSNPASGCLGGYSGTYYEPLDNVKGDVARIVLYVYVRWGSAWGADSVTEVFQSIDVLLEWCELDPVDTWEMGRNVVVEEIQGNRNVFIDYPELAWTLFGREVPTGMTTPSGEASNTGNSGNTGNQGGSSDTECKHAITELRGVKAEDCDEKGYTGDTYCKSCGDLVARGTEISATGIHIFGAWQISGENQMTRKCNTCDKTETKTDYTNCAHKNTEVRGEINECGEFGYTGDVHCADCGELLEEGARTPVVEHDWSEYTSVESTGEREMEKRVCSVCGTEELRFIRGSSNSDSSNSDSSDGGSSGTVLIICTVAVVAAVATVGVIVIVIIKRKENA